MAELSAPTYCRTVEVYEQATGPASEAITIGKYVRLNTTTGKWEYGNSTTAAEARPGGIAIKAATQANEPITVVMKGVLDMGDILGGLSYDAAIYIGTTDGILTGTALGGTYVETVVGRVVPGWGNTTADKLLRVNL